MKSCNECSIQKPLSEYPKCSKLKDGHSGKCSDCTRIYYRKYKSDNRGKILEGKKAHYNKNKATWDSYREKNAQEIAERKRRWYADKVLSDKSYRLRERIRKMVYRTLEYTGEAKQLRAKQQLGYDAQMLKAHIERQFKSGMSWENYGEWHIDHIKPIKVFIDEGITDPSVINALDNLQPLWAFENISKGAKYVAS